MHQLSDATKKLISQYELWRKSLRQKEVPTLHVDEVAQKVAAFYEQIRTIIDWKEEHLMRRAAIIRKLKRRFLDLELNNFTSTDNIAEPLVLELIRGGYFPNDKIEESRVAEIQNIINKYVFIFKQNPENKKGKTGVSFYTNLLEIAACEIEETLAPSIKEMALVDYMFNLMRERIKVSDSVYQKGILKKEDTDILIYIAVQQSLFKLDNPIISYNLLKYKYPYWDWPSDDELFKISQDICGIIDKIESDLSHPFLKKFYMICEKYDTPYLLLGDILTTTDPEDIEAKLQDPATLEKLIKENYAKRLVDLKKKIQRAATYSTASIFITKILSLLILEVILTRIFGGHINIISLLVDIAIPTILMAGLVATAKPPSSKNLHLAVLETIKIAYKKEKHDTYEIKLSRKRSFFTRFFLSFIYLLGAVVTMGTIYGIFNYFKFPNTSIVINFIFIALILFTGTAIRTRAQELTIEEESTGFLGFLVDILFLPITGLGGWMSNTWKQYNAIAALFSALVDMPFSTFVEFLERWRYFIKEKKEEIH
jgi:hypothetical protein